MHKGIITYITPTLIVLLSVFVLCSSCRSSLTTAVAAPLDTTLIPPTDSLPVSALDQYWYQGKAELNRYTLQQNRYRDVHSGETTLIFVSEDFLTDIQVKNDHYRNPNSINILKTNRIDRFQTGIYDYSVMTSVFTPSNRRRHPHTLKVTISAQDWCGQSFQQLNWEAGMYRSQLYSYFEGSGDLESSTTELFLEDEIMNRIRMDYRTLPTGTITMLPSLSYLRLMHRELRPYRADITLSSYSGTDFSGEELLAYRVIFPDQQRTLEIVFQSAAPYLIEGWTDSYPSSGDKQMRTTMARRVATVLDEYWQHNGKNDRPLRQALGE